MMELLSNKMVKILLSIFLSLTVIAGSFFFIAQAKTRSNQEAPQTQETVQDNDEISLNGVELMDKKDEIDGIDWGEAGVATKVSGVVNILLVGQDTRGNTRERSDSMMIASINKNSKEITLVSLMRDLYVQIPDHGSQKMNAAYALGGFELLDKTIEENFGIAVDYNVAVDFSGFKDIIDALGGIDIDLNAEEVEYMNGSRFKKDMGKAGAGVEQQFSEGINHLDGQAALCYSRIRHVGNSDWERTQRQRVVLKTIYNDAKKASWVTLLKIFNNISDCVETDLSKTQLLSIGFSAWKMGADNINSYRIPADGMAYDQSTSVGSVLIPNNWDETRQLLKDYIYSDDGGKAAFKKATEQHGEQNYK